jgi:hypothetical protein
VPAAMKSMISSYDLVALIVSLPAETIQVVVK